MEQRKLSYSERKARDENRVPELVTDVVPWQVIHAVAYGIHHRTEYYVRSKFISDITTRCATAFGAWNFVDRKGTIDFLKNLSVDYFLDFCEFLAEECKKQLYHTSDKRYCQAWATFEDDLNEIFARHRFGYRIEKSLIRQIGSPALDVLAVHPALFAARKSGWIQAEKSYIEAILHRRGGEEELDDALTAAAASVEAALKAAGYKGSMLSQLLKSFSDDSTVDGTMKNVPSGLTNLLETVMAERHSKGDAHGKSPDSQPVDPATADLLIHWAGAFIVWLHDRKATKAKANL